MSSETQDLVRQAFPTLTSTQIDQLRPYGEARETRAGDIIFESGKSDPALVVVLSGRTEIVDRTDGADQRITDAGPGEFAGEMGLLTGQTVFATCVVREAGAVLVVPASGVRAAISTVPELGDVLITAFSARRQLLMRIGGASLTFVAPYTSLRMIRLKEFASRNKIPYRVLTPDDPAAIALLDRLGAAGPADVWVVVRGQVALADPTPLKVAKVMGLDLAIDQVEPVDLLIVGTGPAGLSAAVYGASEGLSTIAVDDTAIGGQAGSSSRIENYLGFPTGVSGGDLAFRAEVQALKFGARITVPHQATGLRRVDGLFEVELSGYKTLRARSVVIATGARYRRLNLPNLDRYEKAGIYYAATELEARRCRGAETVVVGAGNSAGQAAMYMAQTAHRVHLLCRGPDLRRSMSQYLVTRLERTPNVTIHLRTEVRALHGEDGLQAVTISNGHGGEQQLPASAMFVMVGADPCTAWLQGAVLLDDKGFVLTGAELDGRCAAPLASPFETSEPGIFAVGDVRSGSVKRVASAVGEGSVVVQAVHRYLAAQREAVVT